MNEATTVKTVRQRIAYLKRELNWTENSISKDAATQKRLNRQLSHDGTITLDTILLILEACPDVSADWLLFGRGEMLRSETGASATDANQDNYLPRFLSLLEKKDQQIDNLLDLLTKS